MNQCLFRPRRALEAPHQIGLQAFEDFDRPRGPQGRIARPSCGNLLAETGGIRVLRRLGREEAFGQFMNGAQTFPQIGL